jgi:hypothetical protein
VDSQDTGKEIAHKEERTPHLKGILLKCAHNAIKAVIGLKTVIPNIMLMGNL